MANWSKNNRACKTTWSTLRILGQLDAVFKDAGQLKISQLAFWNQTSSDDLRKSVGRMLAIQLDNIFREIRGARYEIGLTTQASIDGMVNVLTNADATVADLAAKNDDNYLFYGEDEE